VAQAVVGAQSYPVAPLAVQPRPLAPPRPVAPAVVQAASSRNFSPFRDDPNSYHTIIRDEGGGEYYANELSDEVRRHINGFPKRFVSDPRNRIVESETTLLPRCIALEEVEGGEMEWYGEMQRFEPGHIYQLFPELQGHLSVRALSVDELNEQFLAASHPSVFLKHKAAMVVLWEEVIAASFTGWSYPVPFTPQSIQGLTMEVKKLLFVRLGASSEFGVSQDDWFRERNRLHSAGR
jgi:hypothetical protein